MSVCSGLTLISVDFYTAHSIFASRLSLCTYPNNPTSLTASRGISDPIGYRHLMI